MDATPAFFDARVLEKDFDTLQASFTGAQSRERAPGIETSARARLEAARIVASLAANLFDARAQSCLERYEHFTKEQTATSVGALSTDGFEALPDDDYGSPPPRVPFLVSNHSAPNPQECDSPVTSLLPRHPEATRAALRAFLNAWPSSPGGGDVLSALGLSQEGFSDAARAACVIVHPAFDACACYVGESLDDSDAIMVAPLPAGRDAPDARLATLWAHEAAHLAHGVALRARGESPFLEPLASRERVALTAELLALTNTRWSELCCAVARREPRALSAVALWWRDSLRGGGAYVPAAWRVWNALRRGETPKF
jgi:hypothetical protein